MYAAWSEPQTEDVGPCAGCSKAAQCAAKELACAAFALFADGAGAKRYALAPRQPTAERYKRIFGGHASPRV
jgi:hypothetical protein